MHHSSCCMAQLYNGDDIDVENLASPYSKRLYAPHSYVYLQLCIIYGSSVSWKTLEVQGAQETHQMVATQRTLIRSGEC